MKNKVNFKIASLAMLMSLGIGHGSYASLNANSGVLSVSE